MDFREFHVFNKHQIFPTDRKSNEYKKINSTRTKLLKAIDKEVNKYSKHKTMINSKTTPNYLKSFFNNYRINIKTQQIKSSIETGVSFCSKNINPYIQPFIHKCNHHYHKFQNRKKIVLAKHGLNFINQNSNNNEHNNLNNHKHHHHHKEKNSKDLEELLYLLTGEITQKTYFNYLHSLFYSLHQNILIINHKKKKKVKYKIDNVNDYNNEFDISKRRSSPSVIKIKNNLLNNHININKKFKRSNSNISNTNIIHLIRCEEK